MQSKLGIASWQSVVLESVAVNKDRHALWVEIMDFVKFKAPHWKGGE